MNGIFEGVNNYVSYGIVAILVIIFGLLLFVGIRKCIESNKAMKVRKENNTNPNKMLENVKIDKHIEAVNNKAIFTIENQLDDLDIKVEIYERESEELIIKGNLGSFSEIKKLPMIATLAPGTYSCNAKVWAYRGNKTELDGVYVDQSITLTVE